MKLKKLISLILVFALVFATGCNSSDGGTSSGSSGDKKQITVWMPDKVVDLTQNKINEWLAGQDDWKDKFTVVVTAMGEDDSANQLLTDVEAAADVYGFTQDSLSRLVAAGGLSKVNGVFKTHVTENNDSVSVNAVTLDGEIYGYPETSDNGFFLCYDKSVVTDTSTLESIISQCSAKGKNFYMDIQNGWYDVSFFFATGANCEYQYNTEGQLTGCTCDFSGDNGLKAMKAMINLAKSRGKGYEQCPDGGAAALFNPEGGTAGALVSGTWDYATVKDFLKGNFGASKMPTFNLDGTDYQMSGFSGFKLVGVKPQTDSDKLTFCHLVADFITSEEMQIARFEQNGWGPSNKNAQKSDAVKANEALTALAEQLTYCKAQGQYPAAFWDLLKAFGTDINNGKYTDADDATLEAALKELEDSLKAAK